MYVSPKNGRKSPCHISWRPQLSCQMSKEEFKDAARCLPCLRQTILRHVNIGYKIHILWSTSTIVTISQVCVVAYVFFWHDFGFGIRETSGTTDVGPFADDSDLGYHWHMIPSKNGEEIDPCLADSFSGYVFFVMFYLEGFSMIFRRDFTTEPPRVLLPRPRRAQLALSAHRNAKPAPRRQEGEGFGTVDGKSGTMFQWTMIGQWLDNISQRLENISQRLETVKRIRHSKIIYGNWWGSNSRNIYTFLILSKHIHSEHRHTFYIFWQSEIESNNEDETNQTRRML